MLKILSYIGTFMAGGLITLFFHCCLILAKASDEIERDQNCQALSEENEIK